MGCCNGRGTENCELCLWKVFTSNCHQLHPDMFWKELCWINNVSCTAEAQSNGSALQISYWTTTRQRDLRTLNWYHKVGKDTTTEAQVVYDIYHLQVIQGRQNPPRWYHNLDLWFSFPTWRHLFLHKRNTNLTPTKLWRRFPPLLNNAVTLHIWPSQQNYNKWPYICNQHQV